LPLILERVIVVDDDCGRKEPPAFASVKRPEKNELGTAASTSEWLLLTTPRPPPSSGADAGA
jgi:hypothetical protein